MVSFFFLYFQGSWRTVVNGGKVLAFAGSRLGEVFYGSKIDNQKKNYEKSGCK